MQRRHRLQVDDVGIFLLDDPVQLPEHRPAQVISEGGELVRPSTDCSRAVSLQNLIAAVSHPIARRPWARCATYTASPPTSSLQTPPPAPSAPPAPRRLNRAEVFVMNEQYLHRLAEKRSIN